MGLSSTDKNGSYEESKIPVTKSVVFIFATFSTHVQTHQGNPNPMVAFDSFLVS